MGHAISVCIPAYNRPNELGDLLKSIAMQDFTDYEVVVCEDNSPRRNEIREVVSQFSGCYGTTIRYLENDQTLGYDGNLRKLIREASGEYCLFMGNDDLLCPGALSLVAAAIKRYPNIGVVLRSYVSFDDTPAMINQAFVYFESERFFPAGGQTVAAFFRRCVVISGLTIHRESAAGHSTSGFDGTTLYQLHLVAQVLFEKNGVFLPQPIVYYRNTGVPEFGNSCSESGKFVPGQRTPESSLHFVRSMMAIARHAEESSGVAVFKRIVADIGNYSYPLLSIQAGQPLGVFVRYCFRMAEVGLWKCPMFFLYVGALLFLGPMRVDSMIRQMKARRRFTPLIGDVYTGESMLVGLRRENEGRVGRTGLPGRDSG